MLIASCAFVAAADNATGDSLSQDSSNGDTLSESSSDADQSSDSSTDSSSDSDDDDSVNAEIDVDVIYDRNESNASNAPAENHDTVDLTVHETANPLILGLIAIMGIFLPLRRRI